MHDLIPRRLAALAFCGVALAIAATPVFAATADLVIDPRAMKPGKLDFATTYVNDLAGLQNVATAPACFSTGVNLPQGMIITRVAITYSSGPASDPTTILLRKTLATGEAAQVADAILINNSGKRRTVELVLQGSRTTIDNTKYSYGFGICLGGAANDKFFAARITYSTEPPTD